MSKSVTKIPEHLFDRIRDLEAENARLERTLAKTENKRLENHLALDAARQHVERLTEDGCPWHDANNVRDREQCRFCQAIGKARGVAGERWRAGGASTVGRGCGCACADSLRMRLASAASSSCNDARLAALSKALASSRVVRAPCSCNQAMIAVTRSRACGPRKRLPWHISEMIEGACKMPAANLPWLRPCLRCRCCVRRSPKG